MATVPANSENSHIIQLWPDLVPSQSEPKALPLISENNKGNVTRIKSVTDPSLTVYEANSENKNGAAVIICPGGGYHILAIDKEGYEVADWFRSLGYTAFVLQYRVPRKQEGALQDALRAIRLVRGMCESWDVDPNRIGILGFSAGGSLSARASTRYDEVLYKPFDRFDEQSARPDFSVLIYPAYLDLGPQSSLTTELKIDSDTPQMFLFVAADDRFVNSSLVFSSALKLAKVPFELHIWPNGGHGFGMRQGNRAAETWPILCKEWLQTTVLKPMDRTKP
jgi:acetyl esterase/lipase